MPLFKVSVTVETVVFAEDEREAQYVAREGLEEALDPYDGEVERIKSVHDLPEGWGVESLVWHHADTYGDLSVKDALAKDDLARERAANAAFGAGEETE